MYDVSLKYLLRFQVIEWTQNSIAYDQRGITQKNIQSRVLVLEHDMSLSECALQVYEVSLKYL